MDERMDSGQEKENVVLDSDASKRKKERKAPLSKEQASQVRALVEDSQVSAEEKVKRLRDKLVETLQALNGTTATLSSALQRQEQLRSELEKTNKLKSTLEKLCRELKEQNKAVIKASEKQAEMTRQQQVETANKFQAAIDDVNRKIEEQKKEESVALQLQEKLAELTARMKLSEDYHEKQLEAKSIELKLVSAKAEQQVDLLKQQLKETELRCTLGDKLIEENNSLRKTIDSYKEQFDSVTETMTKSEQLHSSFRKELETVVKRKEVTEKENKTLMEKFAKLSLKYKEDSKQSMETIAKQSTQIDRLKSLCRELKTQLDAKGNNE